MRLENKAREKPLDRAHVINKLMMTQRRVASFAVATWRTPSAPKVSTAKMRQTDFMCWEARKRRDRHRSCDVTAIRA